MDPVTVGVTERRGSHRANVAIPAASRHRPTRAGACLRIHSANRRSHRVRRVFVGTQVRRRLPCGRPARHRAVQRCAGPGSSDKPRLQRRRRRPDSGVMPIRKLLHGRARIRLRGYVRRNHVEPARQAVFIRRRARFRVMPDRQLLHDRRRARLIRLSVQWQHVAFCSRH
jgi:hypothetical protein